MRLVDRPSYAEALADSRVLALLAGHDPRLVGTLPLGVSGPDSDIDIVCHAPDAHAVSALIWDAFAGFEDFALHQWVASPRPVVAKFSFQGWPFEIFAAAQPVAEQDGWRHFVVEQRLLGLATHLQRRIRDLRSDGLKTEPAFALALGLTGDPYRGVADLHDVSDDQLRAMLAAAGL